MSIKSWTRSSYSFGSEAGLSTDFRAFAVTYDLVESPESELFPDTCNIQSVEFEFTTKGDATTVTMFLARDSNGSAGVTPGGTTGATGTLVEGLVSGKASVSFLVDADYHFDSSVANTSTGTLYVIAKVDDAGSNPVANIRVNWRG